MRFRAFAFSLYLLCALCQAEDPVSISTQLSTAETNQLQREARVVVDFLQNYHYSGRAFREIENKEMISRYIEELDPQYYFLTKEDTDFLRRRFDRTFKTVYLFKGDLRPAFEIFDYFHARARERFAWIKGQLTGDFDFTTNEVILEPAKPAPPADRTEADLRWSLRLKEQLLREILAGRTIDEAKGELLKHYAKFRKRIAAIDPRAVRAHFFDAVIRSFDPHSGYFSADDAREFALEMGGAMAGVGLDLRVSDGHFVVDAIQPGGSAESSSAIKPGDLLIAFAEGKADWIETAGKRLSEVVAVIRGQPDTEVRLAYQESANGVRQETTLKRQTLLLTTSRARGAVSRVPDDAGKERRIGWIALPAFYGAGETTATATASKDVRELIETMKAAGLDGLVIDLRQNPGGLLTEAVALSGLFVPSGPVMLSRGQNGQAKELLISAGEPIFTGPLAILTSSHSASASEVFSGAMKFHRRAVVIGEASTFGKGTMQSYIELAKATGAKPGQGAETWGTLRLTTERFFLPDGSAVQRNGIPSDLVLPLPESAGRDREADLTHALPGDPITPPRPALPTTPLPTTVSPELTARLRTRLEENTTDLHEWKLWQNEQKLWSSYRNRETRSLNLEERKKLRVQDRATLKTMRTTRRELTAQLVFPTEAIDLKAVQLAQESRAKKRQAVRDSGATRKKHWLQPGLLMVETAQGVIREIPLGSLNFEEFLGDTEALAVAFTTATGAQASTTEIELLLHELDWQENVTNDSLVEAALARIAALKEDRRLAITGIVALLGQLVELDSEALRERPGLDVPLRESLRLTAEWANWLANHPAESKVN